VLGRWVRPPQEIKSAKPGRLSRGLAFGAGFVANVGDAYRYLMNVFEEGDQVFLFGFSRGAYTVRALAGVLHMFGLLCPATSVNVTQPQSRNNGSNTVTPKIPPQGWVV